MSTHRELSKLSFNGDNTLESINCGSLQRIADATEKMASNITKLQSERDMYKRWYKENSEYSNKLNRKISALKGVITKLKKANIKNIK